MHCPKYTVPEQQLQGWEQMRVSGDILSTPIWVPFWGLRGSQPLGHSSLPPIPQIGRKLPHPRLGHSPISFMGLGIAGSVEGPVGSASSGLYQGPALEDLYT